MSKTTTNAFPGATRTPEGMMYNGALFHPVIDRCDGCGRIRDLLLQLPPARRQMVHG